MKVEIKIPSTLRKKSSKKKLQINLEERSTLLDALKILETKTGGEIIENTNLSNSYTLYLNGETIDRKNINKTEIHHGDEIIILVPFSGG